jgi:hypothetical protein
VKNLNEVADLSGCGFLDKLSVSNNVKCLIRLRTVTKYEEQFRSSE